MLDSHPPRSPGVFIGILLVLALIALDLVALFLLLARPISLLSFFLGLVVFGSLPLIVAGGYLAQVLRQARYHVDDDALIIAWGVWRRQVPLSTIRALFLGREAGQRRRFRGIRWPGLYLGRAELESGGQVLPLRVFAARGPAQQVILVTDQGAYAISPADPESFQACIKGLRAVEGPVAAPVAEAGNRTPLSRLWADRLARWLLLVPLPLNLALFAYLAAIFARLPATVPLRFDATGAVSQTGSPLNLFLLPALALFGWLGNIWLGLYFYPVRGERNVAMLLWSSSLGLQLAAWLGLLSLTARRGAGALALSDLALALLLSLLIAAVAGWRGSLSGSGVIGAVIVGTLTFGLGGWAWGVLLGLFFVSSSLLSHFKEEAKREAAEKFAKGHRRDFWQTMANGGLGALAALLSALAPSPLWLPLFVGVMATVTADTWATELGTLSPRPPRLITTGRVVAVGTSGGVSALGTLVSFAGGALIGAAAGLLLAPATLVPAALVGGAAGLAGSLFDSLLGATVQRIYYCDVCQKDTERKLHRCGHPTRPLRGFAWLNNDAVNLLASLVGGLVAAGLWR